MPVIIFFFSLFIYICVEIALLVSVGSAIGIFPLILLMIFISLAGLWLLKLRGFLMIMDIRSQLAQGKIPAQAVISSFFFAVAGVLLLIPGFLSDILALLMILPISRQWVQGILLKWLLKRFKFQRFSKANPTQSHTTFEAEFERKQDEEKWIK